MDARPCGAGGDQPFYNDGNPCGYGRRNAERGVISGRRDADAPHGGGHQQWRGNGCGRSVRINAVYILSGWRTIAGDARQAASTDWKPKQGVQDFELLTFKAN